MGLLDSPPWGQPTSLGGDPTFGGVLEDVGRFELVLRRVWLELYRVSTCCLVVGEHDPVAAVDVLAAQAMGHDTLAGQVFHHVGRLELDLPCLPVG